MSKFNYSPEMMHQLDDQAYVLPKDKISKALSAKRSVRLSISDWRDLTNFVQGDLVNMPEEDPVKVQIRRICDTINAATL